MGDFGGFYLTRNVFKSATLKSLPRSQPNLKASIETSKRRQTFERFFKRKTSTPSRNVFKSSTLKSLPRSQPNRKASIETSKRRQTFERFFGRKTSSPTRNVFKSATLKSLPRTAKPQSVDRNIKALIETSKR